MEEVFQWALYEMPTETILCRICKTERLEYHFLPKGSTILFNKDIWLPVTCCYECRQKLDLMRNSITNENIIEWLSSIGVPNRYLYYSLDNYKFSSSGSCERFNNWSPSKNTSLLITGKVGTGKTHLAVGLAKKILLTNTISGIRFIDQRKLMEDLISLKANEYSSYINEVVNAKILIIDDFGTFNVSDIIRDKIHHIVNSRYMDERCTIITTNLSYDEIKRTYGEAVASRINGSYYIFNTSGPDRRTNSDTTFKVPEKSRFEYTLESEEEYDDKVPF